jgi:hypothetical protein
MTTKGTFLRSLDEIGSVVFEEMWFKVKIYGQLMKSGHKSSPCDFVTGELKRSITPKILLSGNYPI